MRSNRSMPRCSVIPELAYPDVEQAIDWLCKVFGFSLRLRIGAHRAQLNVRDGAVVLTKLQEIEERDTGAAMGRADSVMVRVADVDSHCKHAAQNGARILQPPTDYPYGERQYTTQDLAGRAWKFSQTIADVAPEGWGGSAGLL